MNKASVLHVIDSLSTGGAERMAVKIVNALVNSPYAPHLCVTREMGPLRKELSSNVGFLHLERKNRFDFRVINNYTQYIRQNNIRLVHAHSTSVFFALLIKLIMPNIPVVWHVHGVDTRGMSFCKKMFYKWAAINSSSIACVSLELEQWATSLKLTDTNIWYLPNFISCSGELLPDKGIESPSYVENRVICVSNLKNPKDHFTLLKAWKLVVEQCPQAHLFMVGGIGERGYAQAVFELMDNPAFDENITWLGLRSDVSALLRKSQIGVLSSLSEGFPVTLLEYGCAKLGVVSTAVGQCAEILDHGKAGFLVPSGDAVALAEALVKLLTNISTREYLGRCLFEYVSDNYSQDFVLNRLYDVYADLIRDIPLDAL